MRAPSRQREVWEALLLVGVAALFAARSADVRGLVTVAETTRGAIRSPEDFYRAPPILGPEYPLLQRLQRDYPTGTAVFLAGRGPSLARRQRFWLGLLPDYPIASGSELVICAAPCAEASDTVLERGDEFVLLKRAEGGPRRP